ncbi:hypothetical protein MTO96_008580 [Rhipicephalus appendiculatus]
MGKPVLYVAEPDLLKLILVKDAELTHRRVVDVDDPLLSNIMLNVAPEQWKKLRAATSPAFTPGKLRKGLLRTEPGRAAPMYSEVQAVRWCAHDSRQSVQTPVSDPVRGKEKKMGKSGRRLEKPRLDPPHPEAVRQSRPSSFRRSSTEDARGPEGIPGPQGAREPGPGPGRDLGGVPSSQCHRGGGGPQVQFESVRSLSRERRPGGQPTWADRVRGDVIGKQVTRGLPPEHENTRLAQLERENEMMKNTIAKLMAEIAEIRRGRGELSSSADKQMAESVPTERPVAADCEAERPAKKRAIAGEQEKMASRAKSEIHEMLSSLSESMKQLSETVSHLQCSMLAMEERYHQWFRKIESFLENVATTTMGPRPLSLQATASVGDNVRASEMVSATILQQPQDGHAN